MGYAVRRTSAISSLIALLVAGAPALAQDDKPDPRDAATIQKCVKTKTGRNWAWESCIGVVSEPCVKDEGSMPPSEVMACYYRERLVWDSMLNDSFRRLREALDDQQQQKLREMQRAWIASREKTCHFLYDYFQGTMANPMIAACQSRETGRRALFLLGFVNDAESK
jgi:uncharacterized protein YecT (DUF1311 family)